MDLEAGRKRSGHEDLFISYHAEDDVQSTYAGALFHNGRNYHVSRRKDKVSVWLTVIPFSIPSASLPFFFLSIKIILFPVKKLVVDFIIFFPS
jgi:hypothetical protein